MGETTARDFLRWQQRAHRALGVFLADAYKREMPALTWVVTPTGGLVGDVDTLKGGPAEQRAAFDAWCDYLNADRWDEVTRSTGTVHLHAQFKHRTDAGDRVGGAIRADIRPDDETGGGSRG